jgi:hypothetical protein
VVGLRTDNFNHASQAAIERLGAKKDGVMRHHALRRDGTVRDTVMYSILRGEWPEIKRAAALPAAASTPRTEMLIDFFFTLKDAKIPVTIKEFLTCWKRWKRT